MTPGTRAIVDYLTEILVQEQLEREAAVDRVSAGDQNVPRKEEQEAHSLTE